MNILTHPVHTGYQFDLAATGHEFYSVPMPASTEIFWDFKSRPKPKNFHHLPFLWDAPVRFDLVLVHYEVGYDELNHLDLPMIYKDHCVRRPFQVPGNWVKRISYYSFASQAAASRWLLPPAFDYRNTIIGMGMDLKRYGHYSGTIPKILAVAQNVQSRGNLKGRDNLHHLAGKLKMTVVGHGNDGIPGAVGPAATYAELCRYYQTHRVFLNPSHTLGMSTLEAMATGMPVVTFRMINSDIVQDGHNGIVVDDIDEAEDALTRLLKNRRLAESLGKNGRSLIAKRFPRGLFLERWNALFREAVYEFHPKVPQKLWTPFSITAKSPEETMLAQKILSTVFEYRRVGYDTRTMTFLPNGRVGRGAAGCEIFWDIKSEGGAMFIDISSASAVTCRLKQHPNGDWKGRWSRFERMPILLRRKKQ